MGRDYKSRISNTNKFEDGYEVSKSKKLDSYDRNKNRKQNKINLNTISINDDTYTDSEFYPDQLDEAIECEK